MKILGEVLGVKLTRAIRRYVTDPHAEPVWTGPVERRDPDTVRQRSVHETWRCVNQFCAHWTMNGAYLTGRCNRCDEPRGAR